MNCSAQRMLFLTYMYLLASILPNLLGLMAFLLKCTATSIASPLTTLCNLSISTGVFPTAWKEGRIVPVPKGTNKTLPTGYRPIRSCLL